MKNIKSNFNTLISKTNESILLVNVNIEDFLYSKIILNANIEQKQLSVVGTHPLWLIELELISKKKDISLLVINNIDNISKQEQNKFLEIVKYRSLNGFKLPDNSHIILTCSNLEKVATSIKSHCLVVKGE